jgi:transposase
MKINNEKSFLKGRIIALYQENISQRKIAEKVSVSQSTVQRTIAAFNKHGSTERKKGSGRPRVLDHKDRSTILKLVEENPMISASKIAAGLQISAGKKVCKQTIRNNLNYVGIFSYVPRNVPLLSQKNIQGRMYHANEWSSWPMKAWKKVIFSDETKIDLLSSDGRTRVWRKPGESLYPKNCNYTTKYGKKV